MGGGGKCRSSPAREGTAAFITVSLALAVSSIFLAGKSSFDILASQVTFHDGKRGERIS
jgi:hypothetical protein